MEKVFTIAKATYRESVRSKVLYTLFFFGAILVLTSAFFGSVTVGDQIKVIKDFGLFGVSFFSVIFAVISGGSLLHKELSKKTVYNILAKPVTRWEFLLGKYIGMLMTAGIMIAIMAVSLLLFIYLFEHHFDFLLLQAALFSFFELMIVCAAAIFFSSIVVTPVLSGLFTLGVFLAGRSTEYLLYFVNGGTIEGIGASILKLLYAILPHLELLNISNRVVYGKGASIEETSMAFAYALSYAGILLVLSSLIFKKREFN